MIGKRLFTAAMWSSLAVSVAACSARQWQEFGYEQTQYSSCLQRAGDEPASERPLRELECNVNPEGDGRAMSFEEYQRMREEVMAGESP